MNSVPEPYQALYAAYFPDDLFSGGGSISIPDAFGAGMISGMSGIYSVFSNKN